MFGEIKITITHDDKHMWTVAWGDVSHDHLTWDEMLGQVACLTLNGRSFFPIITEFPSAMKDKER